MGSVRSRVEQSPQLYLLVLIGIIAPLDVPLVSPALPVIGDTFAVSDAQASLVITAFATGAFLAAPVIGVVADQFDRRRVLVTLLLLYGSVGLLIVAAPSFTVLIGLRFVQGMFGGSILSSIAVTLVGDLYDGVERRRIVGYLLAAVSIGVAIYPTIGGVLSELGWQFPFLMYGWSILVGGLAIKWLDSPIVDEDTRSRSRQSLVGYLRDSLETIPKKRAVPLFGAVIVSFSLLNGAVFTAIPFMLTRNYGLASGYIGSLLTVVLLATTVVSMLNGRLSAYASSRMLTSLGFVAYGVGLIMAAFVSSVPALVCVLVVFGVGHGLTLPTIATALTELVPARMRAGLLSLRTSAIVVSQAIGPVLYTSLAPVLSYQVLLFWSGVLSIVGAVVTIAIIIRSAMLTDQRRPVRSWLR